jgi:phage terminase small subunit
MDENTINKKLYLQRKLTELNQRINYLEKVLTGKISKTFETGFNNDVRYKWAEDPDDLSPMMRRFVEEYPKDLNGTRAAIRAGYSNTGQSGAARANWLLSQPKVIKALRKEFRRITWRNRIEQDRVLKEIAKIAYSNIADFVRWTETGVSMIPSKYLSRADTAVIKSIKETISAKSTTLTFQLYDKPKALVTLCQYLGILDKADDKGKTQEEKAGEVKEAVEQIFGSIPTTPKELPDNVRRFDEKLKVYEARTAEKDL